MKMHTSAGFTEFRICLRPLASFFNIPFVAFVTFFVRNIKVYDNMILRNLYIVYLTSIQFRESRFNIVPFFRWGLFRCCILSRTIRILLVKYRLGAVELNLFRLVFGNISIGIFFVLEFVFLEAFVVRSNSSTII